MGSLAAGWISDTSVRWDQLISAPRLFQGCKAGLTSRFTVHFRLGEVRRGVQSTKVATDVMLISEAELHRNVSF